MESMIADRCSALSDDNDENEFLYVQNGAGEDAESFGMFPVPVRVSVSSRRVYTTVYLMRAMFQHAAEWREDAAEAMRQEIPQFI